MEMDGRYSFSVIQGVSRL